MDPLLENGALVFMNAGLTTFLLSGVGGFVSGFVGLLNVWWPYVNVQHLSAGAQRAAVAGRPETSFTEGQCAGFQ